MDLIPSCTALRYRGLYKPIAVGTIIAATNFVFTYINLLLVDRIGRRQILLHKLRDGRRTRSRCNLFPQDPTQPRSRTYLA